MNTSQSEWVRPSDTEWSFLSSGDVSRLGISVRVSTNGAERDVHLETVRKARRWVERVRAASNDPTEHLFVRLVLKGQIGVRMDEKGELIFVLFDEEARFRFAVERKSREEG
jgi:hypothetical protein